MKTKILSFMLCIALMITSAVPAYASEAAADESAGNASKEAVSKEETSDSAENKMPSQETSDSASEVTDTSESDPDSESSSDAADASQSASESSADAPETSESDPAPDPSSDAPETSESDPAPDSSPDATDASEPASEETDGIATDEALKEEGEKEEKEISEEAVDAEVPSKNTIRDQEDAATPTSKVTPKPTITPEPESGSDIPISEGPRKKKIDGNYYLFYKNGTHYVGWYTLLNGNTVYCNPKADGACVTGYNRIGGKGYLFTAKGNLLVGKGLVSRNGKRYFVNKSGTLATGWKKINGQKMYFDKKTNAALTGLKKINGKAYIFTKKGILNNTPGTIIYKGHKYWIKKNGSLGRGWLTIGSWKLYFSRTNYRAMVGLSKIGKKYYLFNNDGILMGRQGTVMINGKKYYLFNNDGILMGRQGTVMINGKKYWCMDDCSLKSGWLNLNGMKLYFFPKKFYCATGVVYIKGVKYSFDSNGVMKVKPERRLENGRMMYYDQYGDLIRNKWIVYNGEKIYVDGNGVGLADLSDQIGGPYILYVDRTNCVVHAYTYDGTPVRAMLTSVGLPGSSTPGGTFRIQRQYVLKELMGPSWGKWASNVDGGAYGGIYFHSVATGSPYDPTHAVPVGEYNKLGMPASHGCIRLCVRDAKWIYDHCPVGTVVKISDNYAMPFGKPFLTKISTSVDPTDPEA